MKRLAVVLALIGCAEPAADVAPPAQVIEVRDDLRRTTLASRLPVDHWHNIVPTPEDGILDRLLLGLELVDGFARNGGTAWSGQAVWTLAGRLSHGP